MKTVLVLLLTLVVFTEKAEDFAINDFQGECHFLENIKYQNKKDTIQVRVEYLELGKVGQEVILKKLEKNNKLKFKDFKYAIGFLPLNCSKTFYAPSRDKKIWKALAGLPQGKTINLTCIVFESYYDGEHPFFIIDQVKIN